MSLKNTLVVIILACSLSFACAENEVTKETLQKICPKLEIKKMKTEAGWLGTEIQIPAAEVRFQRLFQAWFIITEKNGEIALRIPIRIIEIDGVKKLLVDASPEMLENARIQLDCKFKDPSMSSLDTVILVLPSLLGISN